MFALIILYLFISIPTTVYGTNGNSEINQTVQATSSFSSSSSSLMQSSQSPSSLSGNHLNRRVIIDDTSSDYYQTTATATASASASSLLNDNRENMFINDDNSHVRREPNLGAIGGGCNTCKLREQVKADNLASIKRHILLRLEMRTLPNITSKIVPREIIEKFYKNHSTFNNNNSNNNNNNNRYGDNNNINHGRYATNASTSSSSSSSSSSASPSSSSSSSSSAAAYDNLQGDDPRIYNDYGQNSEENGDEEYEEEFFSIMNSMYVFPTSPRLRHNGKSDIHYFSFKNNGHSSVTQATLHIYIRGRDWIREHESIYPKNNNNEIVLIINRVLRHQNDPNATHTLKVAELRRMISSGIGTWARIDVTDMVTSWFSNPNSNHGIVIKTTESWMKPFVVTDDSNKAYALYIEVSTKDNRKRRTKRNTSLNCLESDNEERCCRYPLEVDFREFEWDWIMAPTTFNAYYCNGECKLGFLPKYPHTHIMQLSTAPQPCCSPTKMSPISLLYFNSDQMLVLSKIPNMAVDKCSCS